jgi:hypothetical protein
MEIRNNPDSIDETFSFHFYLFSTHMASKFARCASMTFKKNFPQNLICILKYVYKTLILYSLKNIEKSSYEEVISVKVKEF